jgi:aminoglycoside 3-N-acetyltransferase
MTDYAMYSRRDLADGLRRLGLTAGATVMVHASIRSVGPIAGGPDQIHLALKDVLTPEGTLMMYASCPEHYDEVGRGNLTAEEERDVVALLPAFDPLTARSSRDNGALVELLRTWPGSVVNHHVARFVAWGRQAGYLFSEQPWHYAYGRGSALERLVELEGSILLLGCDHDTVTFLHYAEHIADIAGKRISRYQVPVLEDGQRVWKAMEEFDTADAGAHPNWPPRFFARTVDTYVQRTGRGAGRVGDARATLIDSRGLLTFALEVMRHVASDPHAANDLVDA